MSRLLKLILPLQTSDRIKQFSSNLSVFIARVLAVCVMCCSFVYDLLVALLSERASHDKLWLYNSCEISNMVLAPPLNAHDTYQTNMHFFVCQPIVAFLYQPWPQVLATNGTLCVKPGNLLPAFFAQKMRTPAWCVRKQWTCSFSLSEALVAHRAFCRPSIQEFLSLL